MNPQVVDNIFNQDPLNYYLRETLNESFTGGSLIQEDFLYQGMIGAPYLKGKNFNIAQRQIEQGLQFNLKFSQVSVPFYQEDIQVINKGPLAAVKLIKERVDAAYMTLGANTSLLTYFPSNVTNYTANINGLAEALNDGSTASWDGNTYSTYGGLTRATYSPSLNSIPVNVAGPISYNAIDLQYYNAFFGSGTYEPNLMVTTPKGFSYIKSNFQTQQRFQDATLNFGVGFRGMTFNGATVVAGRYVPGSYLTASSGTADPIAVQVLTEMTGGAVTSYPSGSISTNGETLWILNARRPFMNYYVSNDGMFGGGFRDFVPAANNTTIVGQVLLAHQITINPRYHIQMYNFTS